MKKFIKILIVLVIIVALVTGIYFIFFRKSNNNDIYAKISHFNYEVVKDDVKIVPIINETIAEMIFVINLNKFDMPAQSEFLTTYQKTLSAYSSVNEVVLSQGLSVNKTNTKTYIKQLKSAEEKLVKIYEEGYNYYKNHYLTAITATAKKTYIVNFCNIFKGALAELNNMYYNAGKAIILATNNTLDYSNANKLKTDALIEAINQYVKEYLTKAETKTISKENLNELTISFNAISFENYIANKKVYDNLFNQRENINTLELLQKHFDKTIETYISEIQDETQKSNVQNYYNLVIKG